MLKLKDRTILTITAHPGDLEWYCGGTICQLAKDNRVVHILAGGGGRNGGGQTDEVAAGRREQFAAAEVMGIGETVFLDLPDGDLAYGSLATLRIRLYRAMRNYQPLVVLGFDPGSLYDPDPDHLALGRLVLEAAALHTNPRYFPEERPGPFARPELLLLFGDRLSEPFEVNATPDWHRQKIAALRCHATRFGSSPEDAEAALAAIELEYGARVNASSGEAFRVFGWANGLIQLLTPAQLAEWQPRPIQPTARPQTNPATEVRTAAIPSAKAGKIRPAKKRR